MTFSALVSRYCYISFVSCGLTWSPTFLTHNTPLTLQLSVSKICSSKGVNHWLEFVAMFPPIPLVQWHLISQSLIGRTRSVHMRAREILSRRMPKRNCPSPRGPGDELLLRVLSEQCGDYSTDSIFNRNYVQLSWKKMQPSIYIYVLAAPTHERCQNDQWIYWQLQFDYAFVMPQGCKIKDTMHTISYGIE